MALSTQKDPENLALNDFLNLSDIATEARKLDYQVEEQLDMSTKRAQLRNRLIKTAKERGEELTDEQADVAVGSFYRGLYSFKPPENTWETILANWYVNRWNIIKYRVIPTLIAGTVGLTIWGTASLFIRLHRKSQERRIEELVETSYELRHKLSNDIDNFSSSEVRNQLPNVEIDQLDLILQQSRSRLEETDSFFSKYSREGVSDDVITQENYKEIDGLSKSIEATLLEANESVSKAKGILDNQIVLTSTRKSLDSLIAEIRNTKPLKVFSDRAEIAYASGISSIENRQLSDTKNYQGMLAGIKSDIEKFSTLSDSLETTYKRIRSVAKEKAAITEGIEFYNNGKSFVENADLSKLSQNVNQLKNLDQVLNQEYTLKIVSREDVRSGIERTDNRSKAKHFYVIVEAIDQSGNALIRRILNAENGNYENAPMWGEGITNKIYERIKQDKIDDGIIDNNIIGRKNKGYLSESIDNEWKGGLTGKRITKW